MPSQVLRKKMPRNNWAKSWGYLVRFSSCTLHYRSKFHSSVNIRESLRVCQKCLRIFCRPWESIWPVPVPSRKALGRVAEYDVNRRLSLVAKSLYSSSDDWVRVGAFESQPFTAVVGLRQGCALSPLLSIANMNWIDSHTRVDEGAIVGKINE